MNEALYTTNNLWILIATVLVFVMHLGFASLEAGFVQKKNTVNILFKNCMIIAIGLLTYALIGFNLMYPGGDGGGVFGFAGFGLQLPEAFTLEDIKPHLQEIYDYYLSRESIFY